MSKITEELEQLKKVLQIEKEEDYELYRKKIASLSLSERRKEGYTWSPVNVIKSGYTIGEKAFVVVERTREIGQPHQFRSGMPVKFYTQSDYKNPERSGVINFLQRNKMKIILNSKDLPDWLNQNDIGVDMEFDGRTYVEMEKALNQVIEAKGDRLAELRDVLLGKTEPYSDIHFNPEPDPNLNSAQNVAVRNIMASRDVAVIHGPPGTGKTTTLVHAIQQLSKKEMGILVTAPSNTAADVLAIRLSDLGLQVVRIGHISRVDESILKHTLEAQLAAHPESKNIKKVKIEAAEMRRQAQKFKRKFDGEARRERNHLWAQSKELSSWANQLERRLLDQILDSSQVIICTLVGVTNRAIANRKFSTVIIDEAAQALEPATWIPITRASRVVLAGDPFQLPPTVKSYKAQKQGLSVTLIEKCIERHKKVNLLNTQYRMNFAIMEFSNQQFYNGNLKAAESVSDHSLDGMRENSKVLFIDTAGCGFEEQSKEGQRSKFNEEEFFILREHLYQLVAKFEAEASPTIAVISPYREQVIRMETYITEDDSLSPYPIEINTIDGFQGQERDVVYISLVRSNTKSEIGFLSDYRRMNVAMTRAKKLLIIVGDSGTIGAHDFYQNFLNYVEKIGGYQSAWEYMRTS